MAAMRTDGKPGEISGFPGVRVGGVAVDAPFYQAGLAGYSDEPMRLVARKHGCPYCITEAMLDVFLINGGKGLKEAELSGEDHPICGQLMGSNPRDLAAGAKVLVGLGYDVVDVNLACPVKKIKKKARGGHLLSVPDEAIAILKATADAVGADVPLTVKLRRSYDDTPEMVAAFERVFEAAMELGFAGATVHSRTVQQKYVGPGRRAALRGIVETYGDDAKARGFTIGGSGDVWNAADIFAMLRETGVDWVSVARGCIGNPWVFRQARAILAGDPDALRPPSVFQQRDVLMEHFSLSVARQGESLASRTMRKFGIRFARHHPDFEAVKAGFIKAASVREWHAVIATHYGQDAPGVVSDPPEAADSRERPAAFEETLLACGPG
ncbi:MAG: tRNA-dihydrouridine synthase family protein [Planctomycetota bacterium]